MGHAWLRTRERSGEGRRFNHQVRRRYGGQFLVDRFFVLERSASTRSAWRRRARVAEKNRFGSNERASIHGFFASRILGASSMRALGIRLSYKGRMVNA